MSGPRRGGGRLPRASEGGSWGDEVYGVPVLGYEFATWGSLESPSPCHGENREFKSRRRDHFDLGGGLLGRHRPETKTRLDAEHRARHRFKINAAERLTRLKLRREVLQRYGEVCAICGFSDARALHLDHVENNGALERRIAGGGRFRSFSGNGFYRWLRSRGWPQGYQILCANCNLIKYAMFRANHPRRIACR
jgi:hypothetical protein